MTDKVPIWQKAMLTLEEAASYTGIGVNKLRELSNDSVTLLGEFLEKNGKKTPLCSII